MIISFSQVKAQVKSVFLRLTNKSINYADML